MKILYLEFGEMVSKKLWQISDDFDQVFLHLFVPDHSEVGMASVFDGILL
jgi:hypothetical protein